MPGFSKSRAFKLLLLVLFIFTVYKFYINYRHIQELKATIDILEQKIVLASERNVELQEELENINDPEYIERIARDELGLVMPGELLLIPVEGQVDEDSDEKN
ncbi:MAG: FtsB family cell division protein [Halanaerobiales bacterium]